MEAMVKLQTVIDQHANLKLATWDERKSQG
jgi:hypothetical protein